MGSITSEFAAALASAFPQKPGSKLRETILKCARFGTPALTLIPFAGATASGLADAALDELGTRPPRQVTFRDLSDQIAQQGSRVLMVVDDVDRPDHDELRALLPDARLLGRFRNMYYLLASDQVTIDQKLREGNADGGTSEFMDKMVQHPFAVVRRACSLTDGARSRPHDQWDMRTPEARWSWRGRLQSDEDRTALEGFAERPPFGSVGRRRAFADLRR